jgi:predicted ABC-class ATPase
MTTIVPLRTEKVYEDHSVEIIVVEEGSGNLVEDTDTVYYRHEHRFDNG